MISYVRTYIMLTFSHDTNHGVDVVGVLQHGGQVRFLACHVVEYCGQRLHHVVTLIATHNQFFLNDIPMNLYNILCIFIHTYCI